VKMAVNWNPKHAFVSTRFSAITRMEQITLRSRLGGRTKEEEDSPLELAPGSAFGSSEKAAFDAGIATDSFP
jgi:hypothetical protein